MEPQKPEEQHLPSLRKDLKLFRGPDDSDGSPSFTIYDPVRAQYFKISWAEAEIIHYMRPGMTGQQLLDELRDHSTLKITISELLSFFQDAANQGLLERDRAAGDIMAEADRLKVHPVKSFLLYYLFFRIPLVNPDNFLARTVTRVKPLLSRQALVVYALICLWGLMIVALQWDTFFSTLTQFFSLSGLLMYGVAIMFTKVIHELAHAYAAKKYGLRIPTMGVAFLVLFPVLYTDVTDAWKLASQKKRMIISGAGVIAELTIAGLATIAWAYTEPGFLQSAFFVLASANWISSLAINLNPAMRFDGYYLMMDWVGVENLMTRSFHAARCAFYRVFLGIPVPNPEPKLSVAKQRIIIGYAIYTFLYRIFLYTAIALFVYFAFTKTLGIFLFCVEILLFFIWPVVSEIQVFKNVRHLATFNERSLLTIAVASLLTLWAIIPLPHTMSFTATTVPVDLRAVYVPEDGKVEEIFVNRLAPVKKGQVLVVISSQDMSNHLAQLEQEREVTRRKMEVSANSDKLRSYFSEQQAQLGRIEAEYDAVLQALQKLKITADVDGYVYYWDDYLKVAQFVSKNSLIGRISAQDKLDVVFFVPERDVASLKVGQKVTFRTRALRQHVGGEITRIAPVRAAQLEYPELASIHKGDLIVTQPEKGKLLLEGSYFPITASLDNRENLRIGEEGHVYVQGPWTSYLVRLFQYLSAIFVQEINA
ncbi:MAG: efflux RND transporter periplasmic adaptor subunit [Chlamydiales bacterium]|nr:efflux RND transporter periplasmic adaptor subunit [Chlamydiales bacterium]